MKVSCQACGAKYTIADDKVRGRKVKIRCKSCGAPIVVDAQTASEAAEPEAPPKPASSPAATPAAEPAPAQSALSAETWSVNLSETDQRDMTTEEIVAGWASGLVTSDAFVWKEGMGDWVAILDAPELRPLLPAPVPDPTKTPFGPTIVTSPTPAAAAPAASARLSGGGRKAGAAVDLFDAVPNEEDVATSAPPLPGAGTQPYDDGRLTGARNENSVLFSLDALKGGMLAEPKKYEPQKSKPRNDALGGAPPSVLTGGESPMFSLSADQALLTAPAAPEPPPPRPVDASGRPPPNKLLLYGGAGLGVLLVLGVGILLGRGGSDESAEAEGSAKAKASAAPSEEDETKSAKKDEKDEKKDEKDEKDEKAAASASAAASAEPPKTASGSTSTGSSSKKESGSSPSKQPSTTSTPKKVEPSAPSAGTGPFSVSAAQVALTQAAANAASCKKPGGPTGTGKVQVTFATSGRVTSANVAGPPFAGTAVGGCVAGVFRRAKVPPYAGNPITVSKSFSIK